MSDHHGSRYVDRKTIMRMLGVSGSWVDRRANSGKITRHYFDGTPRYDMSEIEQLRAHSPQGKVVKPPRDGHGRFDKKK
jgi:hypothetical protein